MAQLIRCPYCVEGDHFKVMAAKADRAWFHCEHCGHVSMPQDPSYECPCQNCRRTQRLSQKR